MSPTVQPRPATRTPDRPTLPLASPPHTLRLRVDVRAAHLANPAVAVQRLLTSEAGAHTQVRGDDTELQVSVALPDAHPAHRARAEAWARWALHVAGVRGDIHVLA